MKTCPCCTEPRPAKSFIDSDGNETEHCYFCLRVSAKKEAIKLEPEAKANQDWLTRSW